MMGLPVGVALFLCLKGAHKMADLVNVINNQVVTNSRTVADVFEKEHSKVMRSIKEIIGIAKNGDTPMFYETTWKNPQNFITYRSPKRNLGRFPQPYSNFPLMQCWCLTLWVK